MSSHSSSTTSKLRMAACLLGAVLMHGAAAAATLNVCVDRANPTMAMDVRVVRAVAQTQGYVVKLVPFVGYGKGGDGFPLGRFAKMAQTECRLIMGFPVDAGNPHLPPRVEATAAYASTGFVLVRLSGAGNVPLGGLPAGSEVGIAQLDTYAGLLYSLHPNIVMHVYPKDADMLADLEARHIVAGLAWQPSIEGYQRMHPHQLALKIRMLGGKHMLWNLVALYAPGSGTAATLFDNGLAQLRSSGRLDGLIKPFQRATAQHAWRRIEVAELTKKTTRGRRHGPPALYTEDQAAKGATAYYQNCAMCHGPLLDGQLGGYSGPALKGAAFADPSYDFHVSDIFNFVAKLMPAATPGSLSQEQDVAIMAFLLKQNGYPAGSRQLTYAAAAKSRVPLLYYGK